MEILKKKKSRSGYTNISTLQSKEISRDREGYYIIIKGPIHKDTAILNMYVTRQQSWKIW